MRGSATRSERLVLWTTALIGLAYALATEARPEALSRWVGWIAMFPLVLRAARAFTPPRLPWAAVPLAHLPVAMMFAAGQLAIMVAIRRVAGLDTAALMAAVRLDVIAYAMVAATLLIAGRRSSPGHGPDR